MERVVDLEVADEVVEVHRQQLFDLAAAQLQPRELVAALEPFGGEAGRRALEHPARVDGIPDVGDRELAHPETAGRQRFEHAFTGETVERQTDRRPRRVQHPDQRQFGEALAGTEFAA